MKKIMPIIMALLMLLIHLPMTAYAAETQTTRIWIRAQISYESDGDLKGLSDEMITLSSDWTKKDGWFYYGKPLESGQSVDLMKSVRIPTTWNNDDSGKTFNVVVKVEAAEAFPGDTGWNDGSAAVYSQSFDMSAQTAKAQGLTAEQGNIRIRLEEFQESGGKEQPYENNKVVVPGETVSKIVRITVEGEKSKLSPIEIIRGPVKTGDEGSSLLFLALAGVLAAALVWYFTGGNGGGHGGKAIPAAA